MNTYRIEYHLNNTEGDEVVYQTVLGAPEEVTAQAVGRQIGPQLDPAGNYLDYVDTCDRVDGLMAAPEYIVSVGSYNRDGVPEGISVMRIATGETQILQYPGY